MGGWQVPDQNGEGTTFLGPIPFALSTQLSFAFAHHLFLPTHLGKKAIVECHWPAHTTQPAASQIIT